MDLFLRSSLFNQMMQALELGDKRTADRIESLIRNFHPDSPTPIYVYIPSSEEDFVPNIPSPSSFDSDSLMVVDDGLQGLLLVGEEELRKYKSRFEIPDAVTLILPSDRASWNPSENAVAIYGAMLSYGITLPLQPFIARFLAEAHIAPAQLVPNSYRILMWKNSWFFVGREWGRDVPANVSHNFSVKRVPKHFPSPEVWSKAIPILLDAEIAHLAAAAVLPLDERICDLQARVVKNLEAASKRHAAGLAKEGIASPNGGDPSDGEEVSDVARGGVESGQPPVHPEVTASTPAATTSNRKGKEKVGVSGAVSDIPIFDTDVPKTPLDPASDLTPRKGRGKRPTEGTLDHTARPPKRASRVVQYVVSSDEEGADEPVLIETPSTQTTVPEVPTEGASTVVSPLPKGVNESNVSNPTPTPTSTASPPTVTGEPNFSSTVHPGPSGWPGSADKPGSSKQPGASASGSGFAREAPPAGPTEAGDGAEFVSLSDLSAADICSYLSNNDVYVGEGWEHVKSRSCNRKMEFFFNCHSLVGFSQCSYCISVCAFSFQMMSELVDNYRRGNFLSRDVKRLREQASTLAAEKLSAEESYAQQFTQLRVSMDSYLFAQLATEEKLSAAKEEIRLLKEQLSANQEPLAVRLEAERLAKEAKEKAEHKALDLRNQLSSRDVIFDDLKAVLEVEAVDRFKRSLAYDVLLLREFERGMRQSKNFFAMKDHSNEKALRRFDKSFQLHMASVVGLIKEQRKRWKAPSHALRNSQDYGPFMPDGDEEIVWPSEDEIEDDEDSEDPPTAS
ncbi:hypothetical protein LWI29_032630 [Acer saccharum]|uniref:Uncharacterized protein n=1 Tax=Acer saccharum TaxID=4024 RepID=A0AA39S5L9_ACESA|nr:hypothetical protein LWI29_032630 [Acer saccharum]